MKLLGIVGGIAPPSTIEYYRYLVDQYRSRTSDGSYPRVIVDSIDLTRMLALIGARRYDEAVEFLVGELHRLARAGAEVALFASNTPHLLFAEIRARSPLPLVSIVDATADESRRRGFRRAGLLGTGFTMRARFYHDALAAAGIELFSPSTEDIELVHDLYMRELVPGIFRPATRDLVLQVVDRLRSAHGIDGLVLGGTELPLLLPSGTVEGLEVVDTMRAHVDRALDVALDGETR